MTKKDWILIPNSMFPNGQNENYLHPEEAYMFALLYRWRVVYDNEAVLSIDGLSQLSSYKFMAIKPNGDASRNKSRIKDILVRLQDLEYIYSDTELKKVKNNELLYISFFEIKHYHQMTKGHNQNITYKIFDLFKNPLEFYIYAYIDQFGDEGRFISYDHWSEITNVSHDKIEEVIEEMNTYKFKPRIWKFSGDYYKAISGVRQNENTYFTRPNDDVIKKWSVYYTSKESIVRNSNKKSLGLSR